jgi:uncharacterized membrane protein YphA (DoxX/SURF4 family)
LQHELWTSGLDVPALSLFLLRAVLGSFFLLARFRWLYDPSRPEQPWLNPKRHEHLRSKICSCGYGKHPALAACVALVEIFGGFAMVAGLFTMAAALGLLGVLIFATYCTATTKVREQMPVDDVDCVSCYLWRVEGVYIAIALAILFVGPGAWSLDAWLFH